MPRGKRQNLTQSQDCIQEMSDTETIANVNKRSKIGKISKDVKVKRSEISPQRRRVKGKRASKKNATEVKESKVTRGSKYRDIPTMQDTDETEMMETSFMEEDQVIRMTVDKRDESFAQSEDESDYSTDSEVQLMDRSRSKGEIRDEASDTENADS